MPDTEVISKNTAEANNTTEANLTTNGGIKQSK